MKVPKELIEQWLLAAPNDPEELAKYIAQRAAEWALQQPMSMEPVPWQCVDGGQCKHGWWCSETYCQEHCQFRSSAPEPVSKDVPEVGFGNMEPVHQFRKWGCSDWYDGVADHTDGHGPYEERELYTATQLAQARQQGADEWMERAKDAEKCEDAYAKRIAELEQKNAQLLEACKAALSDDQPYIEKCRAAIKAAEVKP